MRCWMSCGRRDGVAVALVHRLAAQVGAGAEARARDRLRPAQQVRRLLRQQPTALLLIEEEDGASGKVLARGGGDGGQRVLPSRAQPG